MPVSNQDKNLSIRKDQQTEAQRKKSHIKIEEAF